MFQLRRIQLTRDSEHRTPGRSGLRLGAAGAAAVMWNQVKVTAMSYRHPRTTPVATAVQIRRAEEGPPGGFTVGGGAGTIEWVGGGSRRPPTQESSE